MRAYLRPCGCTDRDRGGCTGTAVAEIERDTHIHRITHSHTPHTAHTAFSGQCDTGLGTRPHYAKARPLPAAGPPAMPPRVRTGRSRDIIYDARWPVYKMYTLNAAPSSVSVMRVSGPDCGPSYG